MLKPSHQNYCICYNESFKLYISVFIIFFYEPVLAEGLVQSLLFIVFLYLVILKKKVKAKQ